MGCACCKHGCDRVPVVLIGDSIRMGYEKTVREQLVGKADVWSSAENGGNSRNVLKYLDEWVISLSPSIVHINCGLHDLRKDFGSQVSAVPPEEYEENVAKILARIQCETDAVVIWANTTPVNEKWHHEKKDFDRFEVDVVAYNVISERIAKELEVPVNDLFSAVHSAGRDKMLMEDGVHFNPEAYVFLGKLVARVIEQQMIA